MFKFLITILNLRKWILLSILIVTLIGFYTKFYTGPASLWVNNSLGGALYVTFWCLVLFLVLPAARPWVICACVLTVTCALEFLQLWHPPFLTWLRSSFIGQTILGTTFVWSDFLYYFLGCGLGWLWLSSLKVSMTTPDKDC